jgi:hypothetical protein
MLLADYFCINIFDKYGLSSTQYDTTNGVVGIHKNQLPYPACITYLQPGQDAAVADVSGSSIEDLTASTGSPMFWGGDIRSANKTTADEALNAAQISVGMTAKYPGPSGMDWALGNAAGSLVSTPQDMARWFRALLVEPQHLGLGVDLLREFLALSTTIPGVPWLNVSSDGRRTVKATLSFAQGLLVMKDPQHSRGLGVSNVYYLGSLGGFQATVYMWLHPTDASKDVFINAVAATVLPDRQDWPAAAQNLTGATQCNQLQQQLQQSSVTTSSGLSGRRLRAFAAANSGSMAASESVVTPLRLLCELSNIVPSVIKTVPDLLARKAFKGLMGKEWFDIQ